MNHYLGIVISVNFSLGSYHWVLLCKIENKIETRRLNIETIYKHLKFRDQGSCKTHSKKTPRTFFPLQFRKKCLHCDLLLKIIILWYLWFQWTIGFSSTLFRTIFSNISAARPSITNDLAHAKISLNQASTKHLYVLWHSPPAVVPSLLRATLQSILNTMSKPHLSYISSSQAKCMPGNQLKHNDIEIKCISKVPLWKRCFVLL